MPEDIESLSRRVAALERARARPRAKYSLIDVEALEWIAAKCDRKHLIKLATLISTIIALTQNPLNIPGTKPVLPTVVEPVIEQVLGDTSP